VAARYAGAGEFVKRCNSCHVFEAEDWCCPECGQRPASRNGYLTFAPELDKANDGFAAEYFPRLAALENGHFWFEARNRLLLWAFHRYFPEAANFLEVGCGTGFVLSAIHRECPQLRVFGSEVFIDALPYAASRLPEGTLYQMDARRIPFESEFDVIGAFDVLEHIEEDEQVLRELHRAVKPNGGILLTVPQHRFLWSVVDEQSFHKRRYSRAELVRKVRASGFEMLHVTSFVSVLLPVMLFSRARQKRSRDEFDPYAEFNIRPAVNRLLTEALRWEQAFIRRGVSMPAGGSLLLVARRVS